MQRTKYYWLDDLPFGMTSPSACGNFAERRLVPLTRWQAFWALNLYYLRLAPWRLFQVHTCGPGR